MPTATWILGTCLHGQGQRDLQSTSSLFTLR